MSDLFQTRSAVMSSEAIPLYRYRLERHFAPTGLLYGYFGVNGSTADADDDDQTCRKWNGFTARFGGRGYVVGNAHGFRATDVKALSRADDPVGPENWRHIAEIIADVDILVPCWGSRNKVPARLRSNFDHLADLIFASRKPVKVFGFAASGDPLHPLTLAYTTPLVNWVRP